MTSLHVSISGTGAIRMISRHCKAERTRNVDERMQQKDPVTSLWLHDRHVHKTRTNNCPPPEDYTKPHSGQPTSVLNHIFPSIHQKNQPRYNRRQVPTAEVHFVLPLHLLDCEQTWHMVNSPLTASIHKLDDDSLLNVFYLYRPFILGEDEDEDGRLVGGHKGWDRAQWWFKISHVCQRWRKVILGFLLGYFSCLYKMHARCRRA